MGLGPFVSTRQRGPGRRRSRRRQSGQPTWGSLFQDARTLVAQFRQRARQPAQDIVTVRDIGDIALDLTRPLREADWLAPLRRLDTRLETIEQRTARVENSLRTPSLRNELPARDRPFDVRVVPTTDERFEVEVQGPVEDRPRLVFTRNGRERTARILDSSGGSLTADVELRALDPGEWDVVLERSGRRDHLTTVEVGGD